MELGDIDVHSAWDAWHLWHWTGSGGALGVQLTPWTVRLFEWQGWHLATSAFSLCGKCGTGRHRCASAWQAWHLWWHAWVPLDAVDAAAVCVAGVTLGDIDVHAAWQAWHSTLAFSLRGRHGAWQHRCVLCVAGVALGDVGLHFAWQARHLVTHQPSLYVVGVALMALGWLWWRGWVPVDAVDAAAVCVAGVALGDIDVALMALDRLWWSQLTPWTVRLFVWQGWHLATSAFSLCGRCGTGRHRCASAWQAWHLWWHAWVPVGAVDAAAVCVAGVAFGDIDVQSAWQVWRLATSAFTLRGRCSTGRHRRAFCVERILRGMRGTYGTGLALVARLGPS